MTSQRSVVGAVMLGHFISAFAALGMPPFFATLLERSFQSQSLILAGWLYIVPTFFLALSSAWWGRMADRFGKRNLLLRAQIGLAASFLLAGFADNVWVFFCALALQGLLGGTYAASNAYLATVLHGRELSYTLTWMQSSARAALIVAPVVIGLFVVSRSPLELYRYLAILPLVGALLTLRLPSETKRAASNRATTGAVVSKPTVRFLAVLQLLFVGATVVTFPYFVVFAQQRFPDISAATAGLLFGLPHLAYLVAAPFAGRMLKDKTGLLAGSLIGLAATCVAQVLTDELWTLAGWRVLMGLCMTGAFIALHNLVASVVRPEEAGRVFGRIEAGSKWGAVVAGVVASAIYAVMDSAAPFLFAAGLAVFAAVYLLTMDCCRRRVPAPD